MVQNLAKIRRLDKYRIEKRISRGPLASVFKAHDTIEGVKVALKLPHHNQLDKDYLDSFRHEVRVMAKMDHPHILRIKNASFIDDQFVIAMPLGEKSLADRLQSRLAIKTMFDYTEQMLQALAYAHELKVIHCDIKPENFILFPNNEIRLSDFGLAKTAVRTLDASGSGTIGYVAPEQAMGRPSFHSDVFSMGLVLYRMFSGHLPQWPYDWPSPFHRYLRRKAHPEFMDFIKRAMAFKPSQRYKNACQMYNAYQKIKRKSLLFALRKQRQKNSGR